MKDSGLVSSAKMITGHTHSIVTANVGSKRMCFFVCQGHSLGKIELVECDVLSGLRSNSWLRLHATALCFHKIPTVLLLLQDLLLNEMWLKLFFMVW